MRTVDGQGRPFPRCPFCGVPIDREHPPAPADALPQEHCMALAYPLTR